MAADQIGLITLAGTLVIVVAAIYIGAARNPARQKEEVMKGVYRTRKIYFIILLLVLLGTLTLTLRMLPYPSLNKSEPAGSISVTGQMWSWDLKPLRGEGVRLQDGVLFVPAGKLLEFSVTTTDVTHGFGIYNTKGQLLGQTQAMPGYANRLLISLAEPGDYYVLCMEFCGFSHHLMKQIIKAEAGVEQ